MLIYFKIVSEIVANIPFRTVTDAPGRTIISGDLDQLFQHQCTIYCFVPRLFCFIMK